MILLTISILEKQTNNQSTTVTAAAIKMSFSFDGNTPISVAGMAAPRIKQKILKAISSTDCGRLADQESLTAEYVDKLFEELESYNECVESLTLDEPVRPSRKCGSWTVAYPPSNGQLGPFHGVSRRVIDIDKKTYKNILVVPPNDWLKATLEARLEEWDEMLNKEEKCDFTKNQVEAATPAIGYTPTCWRLTFEKLTISVLGNPIFTRQFDTGIKRILRTTYIDQDTHIVRVGSNEFSEDGVPFYMTRTKIDSIPQ